MVHILPYYICNKVLLKTAYIFIQYFFLYSEVVLLIVSAIVKYIKNLFLLLLFSFRFLFYFIFTFTYTLNLYWYHVICFHVILFVFVQSSFSFFSSHQLCSSFILTTFWLSQLTATTGREFKWISLSLNSIVYPYLLILVGNLFKVYIILFYTLPIES